MIRVACEAVREAEWSGRKAGESGEILQATVCGQSRCERAEHCGVPRSGDWPAVCRQCRCVRLRFSDSSMAEQGTQPDFEVSDSNCLRSEVGLRRSETQTRGLSSYFPTEREVGVGETRAHDVVSLARSESLIEPLAASFLHAGHSRAEDIRQPERVDCNERVRKRDDVNSRASASVRAPGVTFGLTCEGARLDALAARATGIPRAVRTFDNGNRDRGCAPRIALSAA